MIMKTDGRTELRSHIPHMIISVLQQVVDKLNKVNNAINVNLKNHLTIEKST